MGFLIFIGILVFVGIPVAIMSMLSSLKSRQKEDSDAILHRLNNIEKTLQRLKTGGLSEEETPAPPPVEAEKPIAPQVVVQETIVPPRPVAPPPVDKEPEPVVEEVQLPKEQFEESEVLPFVFTTETKKETPPNVPPKIMPTSKPAKDFESFIGENLAGKIGIAVLVLGIGYFVKYAIDRDMINEAGRVALGLISGCILLVIAHWQRKAYRAFSSLFVAGGVATFYFTITIAFQQYQMFGQTTAFIIMVVITAFSVLLSLLYDRRELAALSLLGGLGAPFMVSTGQGNYVVLFSYLLILNTGMLTLAALRRWTIINIISFAGTVIIYAAWLINEMHSNNNPPYLGALLFASLFYVVFFVMNVIRHIKQPEKFSPFQTVILLLNSFLFFIAGMVILNHWEHKEYQGIFTALLAVFNFAFGIFFHRRQMVDRRLVLYLFGLVLVFVSLVAPVQLKGNYITLFWAAEAAMLLWFSRPAQMPLAKTASLLLVVLMIVSVVMDWAMYYGFGATPLPIITNKVFITCAACFASLAISRRLLRSHTDPYQIGIGEIDNKSAGVFFDLMMAFIALGTLNFEALHQTNRLEVSDAVRQLVLMAINYWWILAIMVIVVIRRAFAYAPFVMGLGFVALVLNCFANGINFGLFKALINTRTPLQPGFGLHYINFIALAGILILLFVLQKARGQKIQNALLLWWTAFFGIFLLSTELALHALYFNTGTLIALSADSLSLAKTEYSAIIRQIIKAGYPVLWGLCSFVFMWLGMRHKIQQLRIISLTLFTLILAKLFIYDIRGISEGGRIIAFIILGILLLVVSFMYQKIKKIILKDEETDS